MLTQTATDSENYITFFSRPDSQSFRHCTARLWDVLPWPTVCGPIKMWGKQEHNHLMWQDKEDQKHCVPTGLDKNWHGLIVNFFVVNTTVLSNKMYRDNPLAFWSETADNSLNWKLQPELNYPELPWKLQTTKLNYNYLEYRSKTAGNSLYPYIS